MFRCSKCKKVSQPGEAQRKVVTDTRAKSYENYPSKRQKRRGPMSCKEIVSEEIVCGKCAEKEA